MSLSRSISPTLSVWLLLFLLFVSVTPSQAQKIDPEFYRAYPSHTTFTGWFYLKYTSNARPGWSYSFIKDKEGIHAQLVEMAVDPHKDDPVLFWSSKERKFVDADLPEVEPGNLRNNKPGYIPGEASFDENVYYGYDGWAKDVIEELEGAGNLPDFLLNGLARAYSYEATAMISPRQDFYNEIPYDKSLDPKDFSDDLLDSYQQLYDKAIASFRKLAERSPEFPTIVGYAAIKYPHEVIVPWYDLQIIGHGDRTDRYLLEDIYPPALISMAKNLLNSCEKGAILFTNGDSDTFPLLYLQAKEGYRRDVTIINLSLANTGRYIKYLLDIAPKKQRIELARSIDFYNDPEKTYQKYEGETFILSRGSERIPRKENETEMSSFSPKARGSRENPYLLRQDLVVLDLILTNEWKRPIYFSSTIPPSGYIGLQKTFRTCGLAYQVTPWEVSPTPEDPYRVGAIDVEQQADLLLKTFDYSGFIGHYDKVNRLPSISGNHAAMLYRLLNAAHQAEMKEWFAPVLDKYLEVFPPDKTELNFGFILFVRTAFDLGKKELGLQLMGYMIDSIRETAKGQDAATDREKAMATYRFEQVKNLCETHGLGQQKDELREILEKYPGFMQ